MFCWWALSWWNVVYAVTRVRFCLYWFVEMLCLIGTWGWRDKGLTIFCQKRNNVYIILTKCCLLVILVRFCLYFPCCFTTQEKNSKIKWTHKHREHINNSTLQLCPITWCVIEYVSLQHEILWGRVDKVGSNPWLGTCCNITFDVNSLRPRPNRRHFADDILKRIFLNENVRISIEISLKFVPRGPINNIPSLVQIMAWRRPGDKPLSEPMMVSSPTHICVTRPQRVKLIAQGSGLLNNFHVKIHVS